MINQSDLFIKMVLDAWNTQLTSTDKLFQSLSHEQLTKEVAPGKNTGVYLLGHLVAVHDALFQVLGIGNKLYPELEEIFINQPDKSGMKQPTTDELKNWWSIVNNKLTEYFTQFTPEDWFQKHNAVSEEDFGKEPHRNKLNIIVNRTNHLANHLGQLIFLQDKKVEE